MEIEQFKLYWWSGDISVTGLAGRLCNLRNQQKANNRLSLFISAAHFQFWTFSAHFFGKC